MIPFLALTDITFIRNYKVRPGKKVFEINFQKDNSSYYVTASENMVKASKVSKI